MLFWAQKFKKDFGYMKIIEPKENETWKNNYKNMIKSLEKTGKMIDQIEKGEDDEIPSAWTFVMREMGDFKKSKAKNPYFVLVGLYDYNFESNLVNDKFIHQILPKNISTKLKKESDDEDRSEGIADLYSIMVRYKGNYKNPFTVLLNVTPKGLGAKR
jgi:hypothetical protein